MGKNCDKLGARFSYYHSLFPLYIPLISAPLHQCIYVLITMQCNAMVAGGWWWLAYRFFCQPQSPFGLFGFGEFRDMGTFVFWGFGDYGLTIIMTLT